MLADYDYVAIFDADFKPDADFLVSAVPPDVALPPNNKAQGINKLVKYACMEPISLFFWCLYWQ